MKLRMESCILVIQEDKCGNAENCFISVAKMNNYKFMSAKRSFYPHFKDYNISIWKNLIEVFALRISCLMNSANTIAYEQYVKCVNPFEIYKIEAAEIQNCRVFVLSAFPEFLVDYFGIKLWKTCVKHTSNNFQNCSLGAE